MQSSNYDQTSANNTAAAPSAASFLARVKGILLSPTTEWPVIDREETTPAAVFGTYVLPLAALLAIPIVLGLVVYPDVHVGGVRMVWFFTWVEAGMFSA